MMKKSTNTILLLIAVLILGIVACRIPAPTSVPEGTPAPTQTAAPIDLVENMCVELNHIANLYSDTNGNWNHVSDLNRPEGTQFIYLGGQVGDYIFVSYGQKQGWILINYIRKCQ